MNVDDHNQSAWDSAAKNNSRWSLPCSDQSIEHARTGKCLVKLTPTKYVPVHWLNEILAKDILIVAGGGGQQAPILAASGANVTLLDISAEQIAIDKKVCEYHGLHLNLHLGSFRDMAKLGDSKFDLIFNPVSNCFFENLTEFWDLANYVLRPKGKVLTGFINPIAFQFDFEKANIGEFTLKYPQPYSDIKSLSEQEKKRFLHENTPLEFGHALSEQLGVPTEKGFRMSGFYEDGWGEWIDRPIDNFFPQFMAARFDKV